MARLQGRLPAERGGRLRRRGRTLDRARQDTSRDFELVPAANFPDVQGMVQIDVRHQGRSRPRDDHGFQFGQLARAILSAIGHSRQLLSPGTTYEAAFSPEQLKRGASLVESGGFIKGVLRDSGGKFCGIAHLREVRPQTASALVSFPIHQAIEQVLVHLQRIEDGVRAILRGQQSDRVAELQAGVELIQNAELLDDNDTRFFHLREGVVKLLSAKWLLFEAMRRDLEQLEQDLGGERVWDVAREYLPGKTGRHELAERAMRPLQENAAGACVAVRLAAQAYADLGEARAAEATVSSFVSGMRVLAPKVEKATGFLDMTDPATMGAHEFWNSVPSHLSNLEAQSQTMLAASKKPVLVRFTGQQLLEVSSED